MTTNLKASRYEATGGNLTRLFALERSLDRNAVFKETISLSETRLDVMQTALGNILSPLEDLSIDLTTAVRLGDQSAARTHAATARQAFSDTVSALNTRVAGQSLFAGTATDRAALAPADAMLADLDALAQGSATAADAITAIDAYFAKPAGGFYTSGYTGSAERPDAGRHRRGQAAGLRDPRRPGRARRGAARPGDGGGRRRRRLRRRRDGTDERCSARRRTACSRPRRASSPSAATSASSRRPSRPPRPSGRPSARPSTSRAPTSSPPIRWRPPRPTRRSRCSSSRSTRSPRGIASLRFVNFMS